MQLLIDKDSHFKSEQIRIEAIKAHQWYQLPSENQLIELTEEFYCLMLRYVRLLKLGQEQDAIYLRSQFIEPFVIHLVQWLTYCGESFSSQEALHLRETMRDVTLPTLLNQRRSSLEEFLSYLSTVEELLTHFTRVMGYQTNSLAGRQLRSYISLLMNEIAMTEGCDKRALIGLY